jgi:adenine deaminase
MDDIKSFIAGMPKCELHMHLEGALEPDLKFALAQRNRIDLAHGSIAELRASYVFDDIPSFLATYFDGLRVLLKEPDFYDLTYAYLAKARSQNIRYAEMFFDPQKHTARGVSFGTVIRGIRRAQLDAETRLGIGSQLIMCFTREWSAEYAMATLLEALPYREWIIGVGLDSDERNNPPLKFRDVFARAREEGFLLTMHCDVDEESATRHIRQSLDEIGVARIDHGVNVLDDPTLIEAVQERGIGLTVCPISNACVTGSTKSAAIARFLELGIRVTVNSDDPAYFDAYLTENLVRVQQEIGLDHAALAQLMRNSFEIAWLPRRTKDLYLAELDAYAG